jgi:hypothetical protein
MGARDLQQGLSARRISLALFDVGLLARGLKGH